MKKVIFLLVLILVLTISSISFARIGDVTGNVYSTDIRAYINNIEVKSYNIGGKTCIPVEEITTACTYNDESRALYINSLNADCIIEYKAEPNQEIGKVIGNTYETDIVVYIKDIILPSYNIGGMTAICIEDLGLFAELGSSASWDPIERTIKLNVEFIPDSTRPLSGSARRAIIDDIIERTMSSIIERFDTDDYSFLYLRQPTPHGNNDLLLFVDAYGGSRFISSELSLPASSGNTLSIIKLNIDKDLGVVTFTANVRYRFSFNLLTGELKEI